MRIAILSWGSLIDSGVQRGLRIVGGWNTDGPTLPIEFSRISQSGTRQKCLTLVIDEVNGTNVKTHYAISSLANLDLALINLRLVENITLTYSVGYVNLIKGTERGWARQNHPISCDRIKVWAAEHHFDAVIWTSLLSNFEKVLEMPFTVSDAVEYVKSLSGQPKVEARNYILKSPAQVVTPVRTELMRYWMSRQAVQHVVSPPPITSTETGGSPESALMRIVNRFSFHHR
jgi:hypothetical protein